MRHQEARDQGFTTVTYIIIIWHLGKKGALRTAIDSQENILTLLQEKGTQSKWLRKAESIHVPRGKAPLKPICKSAQHECLLVINLFDWVFIPRSYAATALWWSAAWRAGSLWMLFFWLQACLSLSRKKEKRLVHSDSPTVPGEPSPSSVSQILEDSVDFLRTASYRRCNSMVFWKVGQEVSRGHDQWKQPLFLCLLLCFREWLTVYLGQGFSDTEGPHLES